MKKRGFVFFLVVFTLCFMAKGSSAQNLLKHISFKVAPGLRSLVSKDLDDLWKNLNPHITSVPLDLGYEQDGQFEEFSLGLEYAAEILITPVRNFDIGFGSGYIRRENLSQIFFYDEDFAFDAVYLPKIKVIPLNISLYYHLPITSEKDTDIYFFAGVDYYFVRAEGHVRSDYLKLETTLNAKSSGLGFHGGLGYDFPIVSSVSLFVEFSGKFCELKNWTGEWEDIDRESDTSFSSEGTVYKFEEKYLEKWHTSVRAWPKKPDDSSIRKIRNLEGSLSGISCRIGARIRL